MREVRALSRVGRQNQIIIYLGERVRKQMGNGGTAYDIARAIDMRPTSPAFRQHLKSMVDEGLLVKTEITKPGRWSGFWYSLPEHIEKNYRPKRREIVEAKRNKNHLQLQLF